MLELLSDEAATILAVEVDFSVTNSIRRSFNCFMRPRVSNVFSFCLYKARLSNGAELLTRIGVEELTTL